MEQKANKEEVYYYYHYTTQETLCSMLNKYREDKSHNAQENLIFWASSIFTMNDPREMKHGVEVFKVLVPFNENFYNIALEDRLNIESFDNEKILSDQTHTPFVISFSQNRDDLAMWTMYGDGGNGVALKFCDEIMNSFPEKGCKNEFAKVFYGNGFGKFQQFVEIYNEGVYERNKCNNDEQRKAYIEKMIIKLYSRLCPFIKTESYRNENESRLSYYDVPSHYVKFRTRNKNVIPYIEVPIPVDRLEEIILGPCCNFELAQSSIRYLLDCCGLQRIRISKSSIPYRTI